VTSSHNHTDHLDAETLIPLMERNPGLRLVIPEANRTFVCDRLRCEISWPDGLSDGESAEIQGFRIHAVPAAHEQIERDEQGRPKYLGYVVRFGPWSIYHAGDTLLYEGMEELLRPFDVDIALLPINGRTPERRVAGNLNAVEAVRLGRAIDAGAVIPMHYDMFSFNTADPAAFAAEA
jgi:L-ascorbate metabolism protein UlaG (beta-lactamase superfamily)